MLAGYKRMASILVSQTTTDEVKKFLPVQSYIGHESTASFLSQLLGVEIKMNRAELKIKPGDVLIVFQLKTRLPEGKILSADEISNIEYSWYIVTPVAWFDY